MLPGRFVPLAEDWNCDECSSPINATLYAFIFERGQDCGRCLCVKCAVDPEFDGSGELLAAWRLCEGNHEAYLGAAEVVGVSGGLPPKDNSDDDRGQRAQASSYTLLQRYR